MSSSKPQLKDHIKQIGFRSIAVTWSMCLLEFKQYLCLHSICDCLTGWSDREDDIAASRRELRAGLESNWLNSTFKGLGFSLTGWWNLLLQGIIVIILIIVIMTLALSCWKKHDFSHNTKNLYDISEKARWGLWRLEEKTNFTSLKGWESCQMKNHLYLVG